MGPNVTYKPHRLSQDTVELGYSDQGCNKITFDRTLLNHKMLTVKMFEVKSPPPKINHLKCVHLEVQFMWLHFKIQLFFGYRVLNLKDDDSTI